MGQVEFLAGITPVVSLESVRWADEHFQSSSRCVLAAGTEDLGAVNPEICTNSRGTNSSRSRTK